ncbi:MAG: CDP-glycerol glycerophosphotransferase family protein [Holdemanella porci]|nr:CDP-glycerol glycerophosphotransferase family protein [[Actinobacillus] rossii]MDY4504903.1 CDP-glycerol glycerophosphotransferase family protein [[Actinobacillus] rossii]MDY5474763.1 CDP-glycerol glycerophosphotransferase family protein [Holdemanella porci]
MLKKIKLYLKKSRFFYYFCKGVIVYSLLISSYIISFISKFFPLKSNRILFRAYEGRGYTCNPKAISECILSNTNEYEIIWAFKEPEKFLYLKERNIRLVKVYSLKYYYYYISSAVLVFNDFWSSFIRPRKKQIFLNTWHGSGALKCVGLCTMPHKVDKLLYNMRHAFGYLICGCRKFTEIREMSFGKHIIDLEIGLPRNDIFFKTDLVKTQFVSKIRNELGINISSKIILYAPTYRENFENELYGLDIPNILNALKKKFGGEWILLVRGHYFNKAASSENIDNFVIDVSDYGDMQDLLLTADVLITDYSSSSWDFGLQQKPCFLYMPDIESYKKDFSFYNPIECLPYPQAETNKELVENIVGFNYESFRSKLFEFYTDFGSFDDGSASEEIYEFIVNHKRYICDES